MTILGWKMDLGEQRREREAKRQLSMVENRKFGFDPPFPIGSWPIPGRVDADDNAQSLAFCWAASEKQLGIQFASKTPHMLRRFLSLEHAPAEKIHAFASEFGPLYLCEHGLPNTHGLSGGNMIPRMSAHRACDVGFADGTMVEQFEQWRDLSRQANVVLDLAAEIHLGRPGSDDLWRQLPMYLDDEAVGIATRAGATGDADLDRLRLLFHINTWLLWAQVSPGLTWDQSEAPMVRFTPIGVFGAIALQVATRVGRVAPTAICSACGLHYERIGRAAKIGQRNYCPDCRPTAATRLAKRDQRQRERDKKEKNDG
jgi:hypothetical protein